MYLDGAEDEHMCAGGGVFVHVHAYTEYTQLDNYVRHSVGHV